MTRKLHPISRSRSSAGLAFAVWVAVLVFSPAPLSALTTIFSQDFNSSNVLSSYVHAATPNSGQFNAISTSNGSTTVSIVGGQLTYDRNSSTTSIGSFSRNTNFSPTPLSMIYQFDLSVSGNTTNQTSSARWQVGSGFGTTNANEPTLSTFAQFGINLTTVSGQFQLRDISNVTSSGNLTGTQRLTWVLNNSGGSLSYLAPDSTIGTIADDTFDLWAGNSLIFDDAVAETPSQVLTDLKFASFAPSLSGNSVTRIQMDNLLIRADIPEPAVACWAICAAIVVLARRRSRRV